MPTYVDPEPARSHIDYLRAMGLSQRVIAEKAGVTEHTVKNVANGKYNSVQAGVAQAILAVKPGEGGFADNEKVPAAPVRRRIGALTAAGWTMGEMATYMVEDNRYLNRLMTDGRPFVYPDFADKVRAMYDDLSQRESNHSPKATRYAVQKGYAPPQEYEDWELDDPDPLTTERVYLTWLKARPSTFATRLLDARETAGMTQMQLSAALDLHGDSVSNWESGKSRPSHKRVIAALPQVLECDAQWLFTGTTPGRRDPAAGNK